MNPYRAPTYLTTVDGFRVIFRQGCIAVSLAVLMLAGAANPGRSQPTASGENTTVAAEASAHWLIGLWEGNLQGTPSTPGPRFIHVTAVAVDGTAQGLWGVSDGLPSNAQINVQTSRVHIINAAKSVTELTREGEDRLVGTLTSSGQKIFLVTFVKQTPKREQEYLASFRNDLNELQCTEVASLAITPTYALPKYCPGDTWWYSNGWLHRVAMADQDSVVMTGLGLCHSCLHYYNPQNLVLQKLVAPDGTLTVGLDSNFWRLQGSSPIAILGPDWRFWNFPLQVKKRWNFTTKAVIDLVVTEVQVTVTVEAFEGVKTFAGTFMAFRVSRKWTVNWITETLRGGRQPYEFSETLWFAPEVKWIVKYTSSNPRRKDWELVRYRLR